MKHHIKQIFSLVAVGTAVLWIGTALGCHPHDETLPVTTEIQMTEKQTTSISSSLIVTMSAERTTSKETADIQTETTTCQMTAETAATVPQMTETTRSAITAATSTLWEPPMTAETWLPPETDAPVILKGPAIAVENKNIRAGNTEVAVTVFLQENPGISSLKFDVVYDASLSLQSVVFHEAFGAYATAPEPYQNPQTVSIISPLADITASGEVVTLWFKLPDTAQKGAIYSVSIIPDADNIFNQNFDEVAVHALDGQIFVE